LLWNPQAATSDGAFGVQANQFGFSVKGATNMPIVWEACTDLASPAWIAVLNCSLYFNHPAWVNCPGRFYRLRSP